MPSPPHAQLLGSLLAARGHNHETELAHYKAKWGVNIGAKQTKELCSAFKCVCKFRKMG